MQSRDTRFLLNTAIKRNRFEFRDSSIIAKLEAIVTVIGNMLYSKDAPVITLGMRCIAGLSITTLSKFELLTDLHILHHMQHSL